MTSRVTLPQDPPSVGVSEAGYPQRRVPRRKHRISELELVNGCAEGVPTTDGKPVRRTIERRGFT